MTSPFSCELWSPSLASWSSSREIFPWRISIFSSRHFWGQRWVKEQGARQGNQEPSPKTSLQPHPRCWMSEQPPEPHLVVQGSPQLALQLRLLFLGLRQGGVVLLGQLVQGILQLHQVAGDLPQL